MIPGTHWSIHLYTTRANLLRALGKGSFPPRRDLGRHKRFFCRSASAKRETNKRSKVDVVTSPGTICKTCNIINAFSLLVIFLLYYGITSLWSGLLHGVSQDTCESSSYYINHDRKIHRRKCHRRKFRRRKFRCTEVSPYGHFAVRKFYHKEFFL